MPIVEKGGQVLSHQDGHSSIGKKSDEGLVLGLQRYRGLDGGEETLRMGPPMTVQVENDEVGEVERDIGVGLLDVRNLVGVGNLDKLKIERGEGRNRVMFDGEDSGWLEPLHDGLADKQRVGARND